VSEFDLSGDTSADYGFDGSDSFSLGSENVSATGPSGGSGGSDNNFFGGDSVNVMDFGRGPVSNITNASNYDPNFAALQMIGRGLTPNSALRNQISFDVPSQMLPQIEGRLGPVGPKFYSEAERFLQEDLTDFVQSGPGIVGLIGNFLSDNFNDAKKALGLDGGAKGGLKDEDFTGMMSTRDDQQVSDMSQTGAEMSVTDPVVTTPNVAMGTIPQVSPTFDAFGNVTRDANMSRFTDQFGQINAGIASIAPNMAQEANMNVDDATTQMADARTFNVLQGLGTKFNPQINEFLRQNVSPNLQFESDVRPDFNDPNKLMPYMGLRYNFSV
tara:strand:- start:361 stop:1344 length:984 start_codon:yes stop_codon:yes gene_type:complete